MLETALARCLELSRQARTLQGEALAETLSRLEEALHQAHAAPAQVEEPVIELDLSGYLTGWNRGAEQLFGYARDEALGRHVLFLYAEDDDDGKIAELFFDPGSMSTEVRRRKKSGELFWVRLLLAPLFEQGGAAAGMAVRLSTAGEVLSPQDKMTLHARIIEESEQGVLITDADERIVSINSAFTRITGYTPAESIGQTADLLRSGVHDAEFRAKVRAAMRGEGAWRGEIVGKRKNGELFPQSVTISVMRDEAGRVSHSFSLFSDISVHKDAEARMQRMANYDGLTGLPNRCLLNQLVDQALTAARRSQDHGALLVIDISRIGSISDTLGHETGDQLLIEIGRLFRLALRDADILARIESYKFVVALLDVEKREHAAIVAQKLLRTLEAPIVIDTQSLQVGAHIGISVFPEDGLDTASLLRFADVAVAKAAQSIEPGFLFYREEMNQRAKEHLRLESELRLALGGEQLQLHYQPKVSLRSGRIVGAEALLRWKHPLRGMVSPGVFIPVAEETGLILELG
ncbi:MAG TPA: diguanylate cyclase, partial [Janthinobacterium sp.]|nr:diguanylate cyclase [Janthinobacterium sp.]